MTDIEWADPPPARGSSYDWEGIAAVLRARPGEWAKVFERDRTSVVNAIRNDSIAALPLDQFEVKTRDNRRSDPELDGARTCSLWLRYIGEE